MKVLNRKDFHATINAEGYMIFYKNNPIGGAGIIGKFKGRTARKKQTTDNAVIAEIEIMRLVEGTGQKRFYEQINKIEEA